MEDKKEPQRIPAIRPLGKKIWVVPDGYLPASTEAEPQSSGGYRSHETLSIVNTGDAPANCRLDVYFEDGPPWLDQPFVIEARRSLHLRMDRLAALGLRQIPEAVPYSAVVRADRPVVVQQSRLDTTQANLALFTTVAFGVE